MITVLNGLKTKHLQACMRQINDCNCQFEKGLNLMIPQKHWEMILIVLNGFTA